MKVRAVWQFFEAERDGNSIRLFEPGAKEPLHTFHFGRQPRRDGLCLSDYVLEPANGIATISLSSSSRPAKMCGQRSEAAKEAGEFFKAHAIQALAIETAEGCAEYVHRRFAKIGGSPIPQVCRCRSGSRPAIEASATASGILRVRTWMISRESGS